MAKTKRNPEAEAAAYMQQLDHPLKEAVALLRQYVLDAGKAVKEQVKWNSLSFYYDGPMQDFEAKEYKRDIVVFNLNKQEYILLVFPTGARVKDRTGLLEGNYPDGRRMISIKDKADVRAKADALQQIIKAWLEGVER